MICLSMLDVREVVSMFDPAIDHALSRLLDYINAGYPEDRDTYLRYREGQEPTIWLLRPLDYEVRGMIQRRQRMVKTEEGLSIALDRVGPTAQAFRFACAGWRNLGLTYEAERWEGRTVLKESLLRKLSEAAPRVVLELGELVLTGSSLPDDLKNSYGPQS